MNDSSALTNRLRKNARHLAKWAKRQDLEAYRLYDRDIPEFPYAIDRYGDWLHVQLFDGKRPIDDTMIAEHLSAIAEALQTSPAHLVLKVRRRQRGSSQYEKTSLDGPFFTVQERDLRFEVNLHRYLDTGLFLDHRDTRRMVREQARDKRVLNLFAYTGSFTVYAAAGGARRTVTVDMSRTYQDWTKRNLRHNALDDPEKHSLVCTDVLQFLDRNADSDTRFDLIVLDPPSFSNSKRMLESFDVQRDHLMLLRKTLRLLAPQGQLYFSNNRRGFKLAEELSAEMACEEITARTIPEDFKRHTPHRCWLIKPLE